MFFFVKSLVSSTHVKPQGRGVDDGNIAVLRRNWSRFEGCVYACDVGSRGVLFGGRGRGGGLGVLLQTSSTNISRRSSTVQATLLECVGYGRSFLSPEDEGHILRCIDHVSKMRGWGFGVVLQALPGVPGQRGRCRWNLRFLSNCWFLVHMLKPRGFNKGIGGGYPPGVCATKFSSLLEHQSRLEGGFRIASSQLGCTSQGGEKRGTLPFS